MARQSYSRNTEAERRRDLVQATLDCIAEDRLRGATVRAIARRAGVTNGLIRHHFAGKDQLIRAAYRETIEAMTMTARQAIADTAATPGDRLRRFIVASLVPPAVDARMLSLWATALSATCAWIPAWRRCTGRATWPIATTSRSWCAAS